MKKSTKTILIITTMLVIGVGGYFAFKEIEKHNLEKLSKEFNEKLKAAQIVNSAGDKGGATKVIAQNAEGTALIMTDVNTSEVLGVTQVDDGNNMPFPMRQQDSLLNAYGVYDNVKILQTFLLFANPDLVLVGGIDGKFGASTAAAVKQETEGFAAQALEASYDLSDEDGVITSSLGTELTVGEMYGEYGYDPIYTEEDGSVEWNYEAMNAMYETVTKQYYDEVVKPEYDYFTTL